MFFAFISFSLSTIYFWEPFDSKDWEKHWVKGPKPKTGKPLGRFQISSGSYTVNRRLQRGLMAVDDDRQYIISSKFNQPFNTSGKDLIFQFNVKSETKIELGATKMKLFGERFRQNTFSSKSSYEILFGPDFNDWDRYHLETIIVRNRTEYVSTKPVLAFRDQLTHCYTLVIFANQTYQIRKDNFVDIENKLEDDFNYCNPAKIADPFDQKPEDWENHAEMDDPDDMPPDTYKDVPRFIPDMSVKKPADWDERKNGKWVQPLIPNPEFVSEWKPRRIKNPAFRGDWKAREIDNPDYNPDPGFGKPQNLMYVGIDVTIDKAPTIWDNILVTDDLAEQEKKVEEFFFSFQDAERAAYQKANVDKKVDSSKQRNKLPTEL
ncbi:Calreticulin family protein [Trichomonas vaginalis G3]|uniref:Calreticulin family protein n=1 Tax=Trichomonas vaginalis (strain ATCC PRA-98 / G3) TaxID=412133 RepID=A2F7H7_TRIV3|nr:unfolded protein binding [Trichomonas vaginalis G3]EAX99135.1 Calreticulin family protein [Trichomonas vaginalis G3]KAI5549193.1 unfolded protein binding [Trichomonas vaginalis G3]|eukprot:XP_001312065.1 Calreticulin family protein [Trichomonas vaginalis G3]